MERCINVDICFSVRLLSSLQHRCERELISPLAVLLQMHSHASVAFMWRGAMARKLSGWSRRSAEVCWVPGCCSFRQSCSGGALCVAVEVQVRLRGLLAHRKGGLEPF